MTQPIRENIPFTALPRQSALFLRYLERDPAVMRFYTAPPTLDALTDQARRIAATPFPRAAMAEILRRQNTAWGADDMVARQIDALAEPNSVAVVTGQQTGLFIGPLYTIYKALTAVALSAALRRRGLNAVPIFWMEAEDHDYAEATHGTILTATGQAQAIDFGPQLFAQEERAWRSVGALRFDNRITTVTAACLASLPEGVGKAALADQLQTAYAPGASFASAFARLLHLLLPATGLVICNPADPAAKQLAAPVFTRAISAAGDIYQTLEQRNAALATAGLHRQVQLLAGATVLFIDVDGQRHALERRATGTFAVKNGGDVYSEAELLAHASVAPEKFSPNVLLRPLVQDYLLPTVAYAGGAAEVAYFAQIAALYPLFERTLPIIWPRDAFTLIEPEIALSMNKYGINFIDILEEKNALAVSLLQSAGQLGPALELAALYRRLDEALTALTPSTGAVAARLAPMTDKARRKLLYNIDYLKNRVERLGMEQHQTINHTLDTIYDAIRPQGNLQERELPILPFISRHGPAIIQTLRDAIDLTNFNHVVMTLT